MGAMCAPPGRRSAATARCGCSAAPGAGCRRPDQPAGRSRRTSAPALKAASTTSGRRTATAFSGSAIAATDPGPVQHHGVELAVFPGRAHAGRQAGDQRGRQRVAAGDLREQPVEGRAHVARAGRLGRVQPPLAHGLVVHVAPGGLHPVDREGVVVDQRHGHVDPNVLVRVVHHRVVREHPEVQQRHQRHGEGRAGARDGGAFGHIGQRRSCEGWGCAREARAASIATLRSPRAAR